VQRARDATFTTGLVTWQRGLVTSYQDVTPQYPACYRVRADNTVGSTVPGYSTLTASSPWSPSVCIAAPTPVATWGTNSLPFPNQLVGTTSAAQSVTLRNTGNAALSISSSTLVLGGLNPGDFRVGVGNCPASLGPGASCVPVVRFRPTAIGPRSATLTVTGGGPAALQLSGTGVAPVLSLSTTSLSFESQLNVASSSQFLTVRNTGTAPLSITGIRLGGTDASQFGIRNNCSGTLAVNRSCTVEVRFRPTVLLPAVKNAVLRVSVAAPAVSQTVTLTGTVRLP